MITTILEVLVAVVVLIVIIAFAALHFLRADDSDIFDEMPDEPRRTRRIRDELVLDETAEPAARGRSRRSDNPPARSREQSADDDRTTRLPAARRVAGGEPVRVAEPSGPHRADSRRGNQPRVAAAARQPASVGARTATGTAATAAGRPASARLASGRSLAEDSWDSLSDADYWAGLSADSARPDRSRRGEQSADEDPSGHRGMRGRRAPKRDPADRNAPEAPGLPAADGVASGRGAAERGPSSRGPADGLASGRGPSRRGPSDRRISGGNQAAEQPGLPDDVARDRTASGRVRPDRGPSDRRIPDRGISRPDLSDRGVRDSGPSGRGIPDRDLSRRVSSAGPADYLPAPALRAARGDAGPLPGQPRQAEARDFYPAGRRQSPDAAAQAPGGPPRSGEQHPVQRTAAGSAPVRRPDGGRMPAEPASPPSRPGAHSGSHARLPRPDDDDPLTSPSFPAINARDSRSYRGRRSADSPSGPAPTMPGGGGRSGPALPAAGYPGRTESALPDSYHRSPYQGSSPYSDSAAYGSGYAAGQRAVAGWRTDRGGEPVTGYLPAPTARDPQYGVAPGQHPSGPYPYQDLTSPYPPSPQPDHSGYRDYGQDGYYPGFGR